MPTEYHCLEDISKVLGSAQRLFVDLGNGSSDFDGWGKGRCERVPVSYEKAGKEEKEGNEELQACHQPSSAAQTQHSPVRTPHLFRIYRRKFDS